jgi:nicotinamide-nucleotide amidase
MKNESIEIITTGEELLSGVTQDSNFYWLAKEVFARGMKVNYQQCVGDSEKDIVSALELASNRSKYVLVTGGLGPTDDDLTRSAAASFFQEQLIFNHEIEKKIKNIFSRRKRKYSKLNQKQAFFPKGTQVIDNLLGTAPGFTIIKDATKYYFYPGVPKEFRSMVEKSFFLDLKSYNKKVTKKTFSKMLRVFGLSESEVAERIQKYASDNTYIGFRPYNYELHIRLISSGPTLSSAKKNNIIIEKKIKTALGHNLYSDNEKSLPNVVVELLLKKKKLLSTAESCTGGMLSSMITDVPGSSGCFHYGFVTYGNNAKEKVLGVTKSVLLKYGAVSPQCVRQMVVNSRKISSADIAIAVSGIAGPGGGSPSKPVGTVFIGVSFKDKTSVKKYFFPGSRDMFKLRTSLSCLDILRKILLLDETNS